MLDSLKRPDNAPKHNDPFDRLLICQSKTEGMRFLTHDATKEQIISFSYAEEEIERAENALYANV